VNVAPTALSVEIIPGEEGEETVRLGWPGRAGGGQRRQRSAKDQDLRHAPLTASAK
jgi:hypothetical protein